jgi:multidrug efflux system outer membrane protein
VEAADAGILSAVENLNNVQISLAGEVAFTYFEIRGAQERLTIARQNLEAQQRSLALTRERFNAGYVGGLDVANARAQVASTSSTIPRIEAAIRSASYALAVLLGQEPAAVLTELSVESPKT